MESLFDICSNDCLDDHENFFKGFEDCTCYIERAINFLDSTGQLFLMRVWHLLSLVQM